MKPSYIKLAYRDNGTWHTETYNTNDPSWREAFLILRQTFQAVRILYA